MVALEADRVDEYMGARAVSLPIEDIREYSRLCASRALLALVFDWFLIAAATWFGLRWWNPWLYPALVLLIGGRQHALAVMMHEGAHYRLVESRRANDLIAEIFAAWPLLVSMRAYRVNHFRHHRHINTAGDPDWVAKQALNWNFPKRRAEVAWFFGRGLLGLNAPLLLKLSRGYAAQAGPPSRSERLMRSGLYALVIVATIWFGAYRGLILFWVVPLVTWFASINILRSVAEHFAIPHSDPVFRHTRTTLTGWIGQLLIAPHNIGYHFEHHLYPSVPFYRLRALHAALLSASPDAARLAITDGYLNVMRECAE